MPAFAALERDSAFAMPRATADAIITLRRACSSVVCANKIITMSLCVCGMTMGNARVWCCVDSASSLSFGYHTRRYRKASLLLRLSLHAR